MSKFNYWPCVLFYLLTLVNALQAQSTFSNLEPFYINYTTDDGLPSSECHHTIQDQKGYIWIATDNGVSRFDGYGFRNFSADDGLKNNVVFYLQEDRQGRIWMLTMSGNLYYYDYETDNVHGYKYNNKIQIYRDKFNWAGPFYVDSLNTVHVGLKNLGIISIEKNGEQVLIKKNNEHPILGLNIEDVTLYSVVPRKYFEFPEDSIKNINRHCWGFYEKNKLVKEIKFLTSKLFGSVTRIASRLKGESTFIKKLSGGQIIGQHTGTNYILNQSYELKIRKEYFRTSNEKTILEIDDGSIFFGENKPGGIYEFMNLNDFLSNKVASTFLKGRHISSIQKDIQGGLWVTTTRNGLYYLPNYKNKILNKKVGVLSNNVSAFTMENANKILLGVNSNSIFEVDLKKKSLEKLPFYQGSGQIRKIYRDSASNVLWSASGNLCWMESQKWHYIIKKKSSLDVGKSFNITADKKHLWSWSTQSFSKIDLKTKEVVFDSWDIDVREPFKCVFEDSKGRIWVSNLRGLFELKDSIIISQSAHPAFQNRVEDIDELKDGTLVIGTKGAGVILWKEPDIIQITRKEGLVSDLIENIYIDSLQRIWVGTSEGLNRISIDEKRKVTIKKYTQKNGLPSNEINQVEVYGDDVWVATTKGLIKLPEWETDTVATSPIIEKILVNGEPLNNFDNKTTILQAEQNSVQVEFLTIDYKQHGDIQYRYKLQPGQKEWNYSKNRKLDFSVLSSNDYRLEIQGQNRDGYWSKSTVFEFTILPPFWKTWWFVLGVILLGGTILFFWIKRIRREANLVRKMAEAEQFALRSQMNPHFIFNCLASIQGFVSTGEKDKAIRYLSRFSKLIRTSLQFMNKEKITLEEEITMITNYLELEKMRHGEKFSYQLEISDELDIEETEIPPLMVQPFVENSILHAFVDKKSGGLLTIKYQVENSRFQVIIKDNGIGLTESHKRKNKIANSHKSVGTKIIARRLELKKKDTGNGLLMTEIKDINGQVEGTKVVINFGKINIF